MGHIFDFLFPKLECEGKPTEYVVYTKELRNCVDQTLFEHETRNMDTSELKIACTFFLKLIINREKSGIDAAKIISDLKDTLTIFSQD